MLKEIHEQPSVVQRTLEGRLGKDHVMVQAFGPQAAELFAKVRNVQIVACGTSYHAGMVARYWLEELAGIPCQVEVASEFRYRKVVVQQDTLFVSISQSGEPPIPWPPCAMPRSWASWGAWRSATWASVRWCASRT